MLKYEDIKIEKVARPEKSAPKAKEAKAPRVTLLDRLNDLKSADDSFFKEGTKKASIVSQISTLKKEGRLTGKFEIIEYGVGGDSIYTDKAGCRVWRVEAETNVTHLQAAE